MSSSAMRPRSGLVAQPPKTATALAVVGLVGVGLVSGCGSATTGAATTESKKFDAPADRLVIVSDYDLSVRTHSGDSVKAKRQVPESWDPTWKMEGDTLELRADQPKLNFARGADGDVVVPEGLEIEVRMPNADLDVTDVADGLTVQKSNGDVRLTEVRGTVQVSMTNGDIDLDASEPLDVVRLRTKNGDVGAHLHDDAAYDVSADTGNGDLEVKVKDRTGADRTIDATSTNGDVTIDRG